MPCDSAQSVLGGASHASVDLARLLRLRERELDAVDAIGRVIADVLRPGQIDLLLDVVVACARDLVHADVASLNLVDAEGSQTVRGSSGIRTRAFLELRVPRGVGVDGLVVSTGQPKRVTDYLTDSTITHQLDPIVQAEGIRACMAVPLSIDGLVAGTLNVARRAPAPFSDEEESLLARLATQATVALRIATLFQELRALEAERAEVLHERLLTITRAKEAERKRVARELHDDLGQILSGLVVNLDGSRKHPGVPGEVRQTLEACSIAARGALRSVRAWLAELRVPLLESTGLPVALRDNLLPCFEAESGCTTTLDVRDWPDSLPGEVTFNIYRIIQETLTNVRRHAQATRVRVRLEAVGDHLVVTVADNGVGLPEEQARRLDANAMDGTAGACLPERASTGFGLIGMRERAALLGGTLRLSSSPGRGTRVVLTIPADWR